MGLFFFLMIKKQMTFVRICEFCQTYDFQLALRDSANAVGSKVGVSCLDATQAAQVLVALLLPLGNQVLVCIALLYTVLIQLCQDTRTQSKTTLV